jgi:hypothetical protein
MQRLFISVLVFIFGQVIFWPNSLLFAFADEEIGHAQVEFKESMSGLTWDATRVPVWVKGEGIDERIKVVLAGQWSHKSGKLIVISNTKESTSIDINDHKFSFEVLLTGPTTKTQITAVRPTGEVDRVQAQIVFDEWTEYQSDKAKSRAGRPAMPNLSIGITSASYKQGTQIDYSALMTTFKMSYVQNVFSPQWDFGVNAFMTLLGLSSNMPSTSVRFLGANFRFGYVLPFVQSPWRMSVLTGIYYARMFVQNDAFGYQTLIYPQFFPTVRRSIDSKHALIAYLKYVPIAPGFGLSWEEKELAAGLVFEKIQRNGRPISFAMDFANLSAIPSATRAFESKTISFSIGYGI